MIEAPVESRVLVTLRTHKAPPPLGGPWTYVTATRPEADRCVRFEVTKPHSRDGPDCEIDSADFQIRLQEGIVMWPMVVAIGNL
jgi:hypothetical protein